MLIVDAKEISDGDFAGAAVDRKASARVVGQGEREAGKNFAGVPFDDVGARLIVGHVLPFSVRTDGEVIFRCRAVGLAGSPVGVVACLCR